MVKKSGKQIKVGIMPFNRYKEWMIAIAKDEFKPGKDGPKIWFRSMGSLEKTVEDDQDVVKARFR